VAFIKNDKGEARRYYNGKIGTVAKISNEKIAVVFTKDINEIELELEKWQNIRYEYNKEKDVVDEKELGTFSQFPLRLAWAITIHKSQGLTFDKAIIDAGASFAPGQVYVALSRLTCLDGLVLLSPIHPSSISTDTRAVQFVENEPEEAVLEERLQEEQKNFVRHMLMQGFAWENMLESMTTHVENYDNRLIPDKLKCHEWAMSVHKEVAELYDVSLKFRKHLEQMFAECEADRYNKLYSRTETAAVWYIKAIDEKLILSIIRHLNEVKAKQKVKKYVKELNDLLILFERKKQQVRQALQLAEALYKSSSLEELLKMVEQHQKPVEVHPPAKEQEKKGKPVRGETGRTSLKMFKEGKSIADIAAERNLAFSTIESHLAAFVAIGEVDILDLVDQQKLDKIAVALKNNPGLGPSEIRKMVGEEVSYAQVRAVSFYLENVALS
jgi:hypothetical protein